MTPGNVVHAEGNTLAIKPDWMRRSPRRPRTLRGIVAQRVARYGRKQRGAYRTMLQKLEDAR